MNFRGDSLKIVTENWAEKLKGEVEGYYFNVGILADKPHKEALAPSKGLKKFAGGTALKQGKEGDANVVDIAENLDDAYNWLSDPWNKNAGNKDILRLVNEYGRFLNAKNKNTKGALNRLKNLVQAVVRNPILRGDYGNNTPYTAIAKGFDKLMIATGQFFSNIQAEVWKKGGK